MFLCIFGAFFLSAHVIDLLIYYGGGGGGGRLVAPKPVGQESLTDLFAAERDIVLTQPFTP